LDGVPLNDPGGDLNFAHLETSAVERVEVVRGPESALFGAAASAGVVQMFSKQGDPERRIPKGSLSYERGSFQTDRWVASLAGGSGARLDYSLTAQQFHTVSEIANDYYRNTGGTANVGYRISDATSVRGILRGYDTAVGTPNRTGYGIFDSDSNRLNRDWTASMRVEDARGPSFAQRGSFGYHLLKDRFNDNVTDGPYNIAAFLRDENRRVYMVRLTDTNNPGVTPAGARLVRRAVTLSAFPGYSELSRTNAEYQGTWNESAGSLVFGYAFERHRGQISGNDVDRDNHAAFVHHQRNFGRRVFVAGGARFERNTRYGTKFTPRAAASFRIAGATFLRVSAGRGITDPGLLQTFAKDSTFEGNPRLRVERTVSYEAGLVHEWLGRRVRSEVAAFRSSFRDLIVFVSPPFPALGTWDNVDAGWARGLEFSTQAKVWKWVSASVNHTRLWSRVTRSNVPNSLTTGVGQELPRRPGNSGAATLTVAPRGWMLQGGAMWFGERQDSDVFGVTRSAPYQVAYAASSWRWGRHAIPFVRCDNLANSRYQETPGYSSLSRTVRGGVRVEW
jgi:outer membrane cobalamin receptor